MKDSFGINRDVDRVELDLSEFEEEEVNEVSEVITEEGN